MLLEDFPLPSLSLLCKINKGKTGSIIRVIIQIQRDAIPFMTVNK